MPPAGSKFGKRAEYETAEMHPRMRQRKGVRSKNKFIDGNDVDIDFAVTVSAVGLAVRHGGNTFLHFLHIFHQPFEAGHAPGALNVCVDCHAQIEKRVVGAEAPRLGFDICRMPYGVDIHTGQSIQGGDRPGDESPAVADIGAYIEIDCGFHISRACATPLFPQSLL